MSVPGVEPDLGLALSLHSTPGAYALLLGAGISVPSGVPSAWDVQDLLIRQLAAMRRDDPGDDAFAWYHRTYGVHPTYDGLLEALTHSRTERHALLRRFFEPDDDERAAGQKQPTPAHRAIARLVAAGRLSVVLTINFDLMVETALRNQGIEPVVVTNPDDIRGLAPLHTVRCLVVHLHGTYLDPTGMLNTAEELDHYDDQVDQLLDRVLRDYSLIIVGWSARWDVALRRAIASHRCNRFQAYWVDPVGLTDEGQELCARIDAAYVKALADDYLGRVADAADALANIGGRRHPVTAAVATALAKRALSREQVAIPLFETIRAEFSSLAVTDTLVDPVFDTADVFAELHRRKDALLAALEVPVALVASTAFWGNDETDSWWFGDIARFATEPYSVQGSTALIKLRQLPATVLVYAAGVAAAAAERYDLVVRLLTDAVTRDNRHLPIPVSRHLTPSAVLPIPQAHRRLYAYLQPLFEQHLGLGQQLYRQAWEQFEYLCLVYDTDQRLEAAGRQADFGAQERLLRTLELAVSNAKLNVSGEEAILKEQTAAADLAAAQDTAAKKAAQRAALAVPGDPHLLVTERSIGKQRAHRAEPADTLAAEIQRWGVHHPLLRAGLCGGDPDRLRGAMAALDDQIDKNANNRAFRLAAGAVIPRRFYLDDIPRKP